MTTHPENLKNKAMARKVIQKRAIDLSPYCTGTESPNDEFLYRLPDTLDVSGKDLCDTEREKWIWSVGRRIAEPHEVFASTDSRFYQNPDWECLWLR